VPNGEQTQGDTGCWQPVRRSRKRSRLEWGITSFRFASQVAGHLSHPAKIECSGGHRRGDGSKRPDSGDGRHDQAPENAEFGVPRRRGSPETGEFGVGRRPRRPENAESGVTRRAGTSKTAEFGVTRRAVTPENGKSGVVARVATLKKDRISVLWRTGRGGLRGALTQRHQSCSGTAQAVRSERNFPGEDRAAYAAPLH
jgi:hypothetical protein